MGRRRDDEWDDDGGRRARKPRRTNRRSGRILGLIPLVLLAPIGMTIAVAAPFSSVGTQLAIYFGFGLWILGLVFVRRMYADPDGPVADEAFNLFMMFHAIGESFRLPRQLAAWTFLLWLGVALIAEGIFVAVVFKTLQERPANPGPDAPAQQPPGVAPKPPGQPPPSPPPDPGAVADKTINDTLVGLDQADDAARANAAGDLSRMQPKEDRRAEVAAKLAGLVDDPHQGVRVDAVKALGVWGSREDVPTLLRALDHEDGLTRRAAAAALRRFRDERAVPALVRHLKDAQCTGESVAALVAVGPAVEKSVIPLLSSKDTFEVAAAIDVLKEVGTADCVPALQKIAAGKFYPAGKAAEAVQAINARLRRKK
jgi:hypothetical protein